MKRIFKIGTMFTLLALVITSCDSQPKVSKEAEELKKSEEKEAQLKKDNDELRRQVEQDWVAFKKESNETIAAMEAQIEELQKQVDKSKKKTHAEKLAELREDLKEEKQDLEKNTREIENDMKNFNEDVAKKSTTYKQEFKHDMQELGDAFKDIFTDNVK